MNKQLNKIQKQNALQDYTEMDSESGNGFSLMWGSAALYGHISVSIP